MDTDIGYQILVTDIDRRGDMDIDVDTDIDIDFGIHVHIGSVCSYTSTLWANVVGPLSLSHEYRCRYKH